MLPACKNNPNPAVANVPLENRGFVVVFSRVENGRDFKQFELAKLSRIDHEEGKKLLSSSRLVPGIPHLRTTANESEKYPESEYVTTALLVKYHVGCDARELYLSVAFTRTALQGGQCSCCFFHGDQPLCVCTGIARDIHVY